MNRSDGAPRPPSEGYRALVESFPNGALALFDAELRYRIVGPETLPFSGLDAADLVGKAVHDTLPEATADRLEPELRATVEGESRAFDVEFENCVHHVETRPVEVDGDRYGVLVTQDVTEERRAETELQRKNEHLDQFATMLSHDLRNPLNVAAGRLELYRETGDGEHLDSAEDALGRIDELVTDLRALARLDDATDGHDLVSLSDVARAAWRMIETRAATLETEEASVGVDESQLQTLLENLFRNAVEHGGDDVTVRVGSLEDGFFVEDTGGGVDPEVRDDVFDHGVTTNAEEGGTGLAIVRRVARVQGLDVTLAESPEGGARFEFRSRQ